MLQWNAVVELLPLWLAPNMVTLIGFFFILANIGLLVIYIPDLVGPVCAPLIPTLASGRYAAPFLSGPWADDGCLINI